MAFSLLNAAKPLSSVKLHGSELYRLSIHCLKIVFPFISSKFIAFHSNCMSSVLVLLGSLYERTIYFCLSRGYFLPIFPIPCIHLLSVLHHLNLPISPIRRLYWLLIVFATLSVSYCVILQSCDGQSQKMGLILVCPTLQSQSQIGLHLGDTVAEQAQAIITESSELELIPSSTRITKFSS